MIGSRISSNPPTSTKPSTRPTTSWCRNISGAINGFFNTKGKPIKCIHYLVDTDGHGLKLAHTSRESHFASVAHDEPNRAVYPFDGFIDAKGRVAIAAHFEDALDFSEGPADVSDGKHWGFIAATGLYRTKPRFRDASSLACGIAKVALSESASSFADAQGKLLGSYQAGADCGWLRDSHKR